MFTGIPQPSRCPDCGETYWPGEPHQCDVDKKFIEGERAKRAAVLKDELTVAREELRPDHMAATVAAWEKDATVQPCPEEDAAHVSLPALRDFADWQRDHEEGL